MSHLRQSEVVVKLLQSLISDREIPSHPPQELSKIEGFEILYNALLEFRKAFIGIGNGELTYPIKGKGYLPGVLKGLQATLQHLIWQTKVIASGDFSQRVDFLGEFSQAFNDMTRQLEKTLHESAQSQRALKEAKEHFEAIFNTSPDPTLITRYSDGVIVDINQAFLALTCYTRDEVIGANTLEINFYENHGDRHNWMKELQEQGFSKNREMVFRKKSGEKITALLSAKVITLNGYSHIISVVRDITERKQSEERLKKSEERYRVLAENIRDVIWILDTETMHFVYVSPSVYNLRGYTAEEVMSAPLEAALTPEGAAYVQGVISQRVTGFLSEKETLDRYFMEELEQPCKDGTTVWTEVIANFYRNEENGHVEVRGVTRDISERKLTEKKLQQSEEKYRLLIEHALEAILVIQDGKLKFSNPMAAELSGYSQEELTSIPFAEFIYPEDRELVASYYLRQISGESADFRYQYRMLRKDKSIRWVEMNSVLIEWEGRDATLNFQSDITERKQSEEEIVYLSYHDQLTGLYNRRFYEEELKRLDTARNLPITLIMADVNGLKLTNDAFGHLAGDQLIKGIADILKKECRIDDIVARIGGDEFMLVLPNTDSAEAERIVHRINVSIGNTKINNTILSVSFGWGTKDQDNKDITQIYMQAEDHMYRNKLSESTSMKSETIKLITKTLYEKNEREQHHSERVSEFCKNIGIALGLGSNEVNELKIAGLLHDIGKIGINENILNKPETLNAYEWVEIKRHPEIGYQILRSINEFSRVAEFVLAHHERIDGKGYPRGLINNEIPLQSKILIIADAYDAMTTDKIYQAALSEETAIKELKNNAGKQVDADVARVFVEQVLKKVW
ncbi:Cyclic di-GMP phosphodiesterase response regulator RpfG [Sporomusa ovata DSM 2662]|uniref:Diguanylate cyclase/phosphodiesterase (GGDEF & EAL domains) with PAS/PAC sensor(S) n=1 Tax=Sporomusa ovata TaxID=2378 RepID=A0A0U1L661_9FIRM|nr:PAS domain S-box protein [Sporomusa ovata]EQB26058.1 PAS domain S-box/diguanylate cyclase (GGDEF) domain-containing protein [Sporomusa ovata DSM 2662]CQR74633.1 diguanylate cyclase/phosphodiesterase (GGDEF & EAL domains) with PAS/PAC sensor(s) [Sporomusa ovata]